jgi:hypothetical protein
VAGAQSQPSDAQLSAATAYPRQGLILRLFDWIWHIRGEVPLAPGQSGAEAFDRLDALFQEPGTVCERAAETLAFRKTNQLAQDKMAVFDGGVLRIEQAAAGLVLRYHLTSRALLVCFLAPLFFLAVAQITIYVGELQKPGIAAKKEAAQKKKEKEKGKKKDDEIQLNPIDKFLGAPAPEKPKAEKAKKDAKTKEDNADDDDGFSPTPAYVFAGIFAALYVLGRILEAWLIRRLFRKTLA